MKAFSSRHPHLPLLLIWLVATAFNLLKAVHIDDTIYLEIARWITVSPLHPMVGRVNWVNTLEPISQISSSPLLFVYALAAVVRVFGESEIALHGLMALLTGVCIWSFYYLATLLRIRDKMALTAMLALGPALLPSQNLMLDVPLVAFSLLFFWALLASYEASSRRQTVLLLLAGLAAGAGALTKYPGLILIPLLLVYVVATGQFARAWVILIPVSLFGGWCAFNVFDYGGVHVLQTNNGSVGAGSVGGSIHLYRLAGLPLLQLPGRVLDGLMCLGATSPFTLLGLLYLMQGRRRRYGLFAVAAIAVLSFIVTFVFQGEDLVPALLRVSFLSCALVLVLVLGHSVWRSKAKNAPERSPQERALPPVFRTMLLWWLALSSCFVLLLVPFMAVRHVLTLVPVMLLLLGVYVFPHVSRRSVFWTTMITGIVGAWLGAGDWQMANCARVEASRIRSALPESAHIYFVGHWGWQWYAGKNGMRQYDLQTTQLMTGDYLVAPHIIGAVPISARYGPYLKPVRDFAYSPPSSFLPRTVSSQANFYGGGWNPLPWTLSSGPLETFTVFQVTPTPEQHPVGHLGAKG